MKTESIEPRYNDNYGAGWIGFTYYDDSFISKGIAWFTRTGTKHPHVSHVLVVTSPGECIEAQPKGVVRADLAKYFDDPHCHIFFRKPTVFSRRIADQIVAAATSHLGDKYGYSLILADALAGSMLGRLVNKLTCNIPNRLVSGWLDSRKQEICSELGALCLQAVPELRGRGCLEMPACIVTPQMLAFDEQVFEPML